MKDHSLSPAKEDSHNQCMREPDFHAVDQPIACALEDGEVVMIRWVSKNMCDTVHGGSSSRSKGS